MDFIKKQRVIPLHVQSLVYISTVITLLAVIFQLNIWKQNGYSQFSWIALLGGLLASCITLFYEFYARKSTNSLAGAIGAIVSICICLYIVVVKYRYDHKNKNKNKPVGERK